MSGVARLSGTGLWVVPAAMLVVFALLLAVPEDYAPAAVRSSSMPYTETVIAPEVSRAYSTTSGTEPGHAELSPDLTLMDAAVSRNAGAVTADQEELSVVRFELVGQHPSATRPFDSIGWNNDDVFYLHLASDFDIKMIDASANTITTWKLLDTRSYIHNYVILGYGYAGTVDSSGQYYFSVYREKNSDDVDLIFRLDPDTGSLTAWNEKGLVGGFSNDYRLFADGNDNLYFALPSGMTQYGTDGDTIDVPKDVPTVTLSSTTGSDRLGVEFITVHVEVDSRGGRIYGTLTAPDGTFRLKGNQITSLTDTRSFDGLSMPGTLGKYTATVEDRFGTATATMTLTDAQKTMQTSSPLPQTESQSVLVLANKLNPNTNQITTFYRDGDNLPHMTLLEVDESGIMYFGVSHGTRDHDATGIAKFDQRSGIITTWPNIQCNTTDMAVAGDKAYCLTRDKIAELDMSSNTLRQWTGPIQNPPWVSIGVDSAGTVFFIGGGTELNSSALTRFVPSTGMFTEFDIERIQRVHVDSDTLHAVQFDNSGLHALTIR